MKNLIKPLAKKGAELLNKNLDNKHFKNVYSVMQIVKIFFIIVLIGFFIYFYVLAKEYENRPASIEETVIHGHITF